MNDIIYISSDEEDDKQVDHSTALFDDEKPNRTAKRKPVSSDVTVEEEEDDDDCVVLDGDPYKKQTTFDTCVADDDIVLLGQKGEVACRDFPHPRHACAKYPFKSTSHDKYCDMCHCYVCDIRAPCLHWFIGISTIDHCHANDKDQIWKNQRECTRSEILLPLQNSRFGFQASSPSTVFTSRPNTYIRPGYKPEQPITFPQTPGLQPRAPRLFQNQSNNGFYNGNYASPQVLSSSSSSSYTWTQRPSGETTLVDVPQGYNRYVTPPPPTARTSAGTPNQQQSQQSGRSINIALSDIEDWLMDIGQRYSDD